MTAFERETVINMSDGDDTVRVWSAQRSVIHHCRTRAEWTEVRSGYDGEAEWAEFTIPRALFRFTEKKRHVWTDEERAATRDRLAAARRAAP